MVKNLVANASFRVSNDEERDRECFDLECSVVKKLAANASFGVYNDEEAGVECLVRSFQW